MIKKNPYGNVTFRSAVASDINIPGSDSREKLVASNGEINAGSRRELFLTIANMMTAAAENGGIVSESQAIQKELLSKKHREMVQASFDSKDQLMAVGEVMADELYITANRDGIARRFLARQDLAQGQIPTVRMRMKNVVAVEASSPSKVQTQLVRDNVYYPPEFYISVRPYIEKRDIDRSNTDVLEEKYVEGLEGTMVKEDVIWRRLALQTVNVANPYSNIIGTTTPESLGQVRNLVSRWGIPARYWLIANDLWTDIIKDTGFQAVIDPVSKHELLLSGELGTIFGMTIVSDAYRHPEHKFLEQGEMFIVGDAVNHGQYTDRGGIESQPIDGTHESVPGRGWFMTETMSMVIANARSVARARRT